MQLLGIPQEKHHPVKSEAFEKIEPEIPKITKFDTETNITKSFFARYNLETENQEWMAFDCSICEFSSNNRTDVRRHFIAHFDTELYTKFK